MVDMLHVPQPDKERSPRQRSINVADLFLARFTTPWSRPPSLPAYTWRAWVLNQPIAMICRETLISYMLSLDWAIIPRDPDNREELAPVIRHYTKLFDHGGNYLGTDWTGLLEWIAGDLLDIPFGGAAELGRKNDSPDGRVMWLRPLDGGTLYPTLNSDYPVVQYYQGYDAVAFPAHAIARTYMSPHQFIWREGWGMAPPEKVYFALDLLSRGDKYYANLLMDVPTSGILDLGDMEKSSAEEWVTAFKDFVNDTSTAFRIPVLYEHNNPVEFIPFGKVPNDIMFDRITLKYAAILSAAYGLGLSDIGIQATSASGETLAGSIRQERRSRKVGISRVKAKLKYFIDQILPDSLELKFIDYDDELNVALGRARLASATAFNLYKQMGSFSKQEIRSQTIADGLFSLNLPDEIPADAEEMQPAPAFGAKPTGGKPGKPNKEPEVVGNPKPPSAGGEGKSISYKAKTKVMDSFIANLVTSLAPQIYEQAVSVPEDDVYLMKSFVQESLFSDGDELGLQGIIDQFAGQKLVEFKYDGLEDELKSLVRDDTVSVEPYVKVLKHLLNKGFTEYIGKAIAYVLNESIFGVGEQAEFDPTVFLEQVSEHIYRSLPEYINSHIQYSLDILGETIQKDNAARFELEKVEKSRPVVQPKQPDTHIHLPPVNITNTIPEREAKVDVHVEPAQVTVLPPDVHVQVDAPESPDVNVNVEKSVINIPASPVMVNVPPAEVTVNVPQQAAPVVNVDVNPTPVEVKNTVNVPKPEKSKKTIKIEKQVDGSWTGESK